MDKEHHFNAEAGFDEDVKPILLALIRTCKHHGISMVAGFYIQQGAETHTIAVTKALTPAGAMNGKLRTAAHVLESENCGMVSVDSEDKALELLELLAKGKKLQDIAEHKDDDNPTNMH